MSYILLLVINLIIVFIASVVLYSKIKKNSIPSRIEEYTREVERLIIELNRALEDVVGISEEKIEELKRLIKKADRVVRKSGKNVKVQNAKEAKNIELSKNKKDRNIAKEIPAEDVKNKEQVKQQIKLDEDSLIEKTRHLIGMGYSRDEIAKILGITQGEVDFLKSLSTRKT